MATSTRRRKPAAPDAPVPDTLTLDTAAVAPPSDAAASPEPAAEPPKRPRAPRKTPAARKRAGTAAAPAEADVAAPAAVEPPADTPAEAPAPRAPRPRRKREAAAAAEPALEVLAAEAVIHGDDAAAAPGAPAPVSNDEANDEANDDEPIDEPPPPQSAPEAVTEPAAPARASDAPPEPPAAPAPPPLPPTSRLGVEDDGLQRRLRWQTGARCPETLGQALRRWQLAGLDGPLPLSQVDDLAELLAIAARTGHEVEVEPAVWAHLARLGDLQGRIAHLESRHPQGLDPAAQPEGSLLAGWRPCQLEAAFFAACVGRCVLADEPALQPEAELLLAARLVMQHFGAEALVVQAPAEAHASWQTAWQAAWAPGGAAEAPGMQPALHLLALDQDVPTGTELLLLDQRAGVAPAQAETPAAQTAPWLWVLAPADLLGQPGALPLLAAVDQLRQGGLAAWQRDGEAEALAPLLLARRFADVAAQWPAWRPAEYSTPAPAGEDTHQAELAQRLARWQRSGFLADSDQLALRRALQAAWDSARATNAAALPALLREALAAGAGRIVVFSEDAATLPALADALRAEGLPADALPATGAPRQVDQALRAFRDTAEPCILLAADGPGGDGPRIGVQLASPLVVHLDTPWAAGTLDRRLQRVRPGAAQREVPVWQLLPEGSLMARRARAQPVAEAAPATAPITSLTGALLRGPALATWQAELDAVAAPMTQPDAPT
jgi:hypothetical protein